jgi:signal transduction histidine kinase
MSEISTGTFELDIKEIEISEILNFIVVDHKQKAKSKGLSLKFINKTDRAVLKIDEYTFSQIFVNLVDNAIKYTNEGSINVILSKTESETIIEVQDTGIGISEEYLPEIFDAFSQEQQGYTRKYEGNGLGLALVDNYVEINKGIISIKSKKGVGSIFRVEF